MTPSVGALTLLGKDTPELSFYSEDGYSSAKVSAIENIGWSKPVGGLWLSPLLTPGESHWTSYLATMDRRARGGVLQTVAVAPEARLLRIDSLSDLKVACSAYGDGDLFPVLDFEAMAGEWDGIYLTANGHAATCFPSFGAPSLIGWDFESALLFSTASVAAVTLPSTELLAALAD